MYVLCHSLLSHSNIRIHQLVYLIVAVSTQKAPLPLIAIVMLSAVYGLQAIIFLLKREFMLIGWMVLYLIA